MFDIVCNLICLIDISTYIAEYFINHNSLTTSNNSITTIEEAASQSSSINDISQSNNTSTGSWNLWGSFKTMCNDIYNYFTQTKPRKSTSINETKLKHRISSLLDNNQYLRDQLNELQKKYTHKDSGLQFLQESINQLDRKIPISERQNSTYYQAIDIRFYSSIDSTVTARNMNGHYYGGTLQPNSLSFFQITKLP